MVRVHESQSEPPSPGSRGSASQTGNTASCLMMRFVTDVYCLCVNNRYDSATLSLFVLLSVPQMGLLLDLSPDGGMDDEGNDDELEAELLNLVGGGGGGGGRSQGKRGEGRGENDKSVISLPV